MSDFDGYKINGYEEKKQSPCLILLLFFTKTSIVFKRIFLKIQLIFSMKRGRSMNFSRFFRFFEFSGKTNFFFFIFPKLNWKKIPSSEKNSCRWGLNVGINDKRATVLEEASPRKKIPQKLSRIRYSKPWLRHQPIICVHYAYTQTRHICRSIKRNSFLPPFFLFHFSDFCSGLPFIYIYILILSVHKVIT